MNEAIAKELEVLWADHDDSVDEKLEAFVRLKAIATKADLPQLIEAIKSDRNDFWTRELLSDPISDLGGTDCLIELFQAHKKNTEEGHDNDGLSHHLMEIAWVDPAACKRKLNELMSTTEFAHKDLAQWLLQFCE